MPFLREAANNLDDPDFAGRARQCLDDIEGSHAAGLSMAVVRAVASLKPDGAADALLEYLPYAEDDKVEQEVETALAAVALKDGKPESAVVRAPRPTRRRCAGPPPPSPCVRVGGEEQKAAVRALLKDPKPTVRFRAAMALADAYQRRRRAGPDRPARRSAGGAAEAGRGVPDHPGRRVGRGRARRATTPPRASLRRDAWAAWWHGIDDKVLLDEFKSRTLTDDERDHALALIQKLDDVSAEVREKASTELVGMGLRVAPLLRQAAASPNPRIGPFALKCLQLIEKDIARTRCPPPPAGCWRCGRRTGPSRRCWPTCPTPTATPPPNSSATCFNAWPPTTPRPSRSWSRRSDDKIGVRRSAAAVALSAAAPATTWPPSRSCSRTPTRTCASAPPWPS